MGEARCVVFMFGVVGTIVCVYTLPRMVIDGILCGAEAIVFGALMLVIIGLAAGLLDACPIAAALLSVLFVFGMGSLPYIRHRLHHRGLTAIIERDIDDARRAIAFNHKNVFAHLTLAERLFELGRYTEARAEFEATLDLDADEKKAARGIEDCDRMHSIARGDTWLCYVCGAANEPKALQCFKCRTPRGRARHQSGVHRVAVWGATAAEGAVVVLMLTNAVSMLAAFGLSVLIAMGFWLIYSFASPMED